MICTGVVPCLYSGLAKNKKLCPCLSNFPGFFAVFKVWLFSKWGNKLYTKAVKQDVLVNF